MEHRVTPNDSTDAASATASHSDAPNAELHPLIRDELERVVNGPLATSPQLARFLQFVVDETLTGRASQLKGYTVAVHAMGRGHSFDSSADAAVRVAARQLRFKLTEYYAPGGAGERNTLQIGLPKGGYVPIFTTLVPHEAPTQRASLRQTAADQALSQQAVLQQSASDLATTVHARVAQTNSEQTTSVPIWFAQTSWRQRTVTIGIAALLVIATFIWSRWSSSPTEIPVIAVLPFENLTGAPDDSLLSDGLSVEVANALSRDPALRVVARTSTLTFRDKPMDVREIARQLGATYVVEGTLRRDGDRYRVSVQADAAVDGTRVWAQQYDIDRLGAFSLHDVIAMGVYAAISSALPAGHDQLHMTHAPRDARVLPLLAEGRLFWNQRSDSSLIRAVSRFEQAAALDSLYAPTWSALAGVLATMEVNHITAPGVSAAKALRAASRSIALDSLSGEPWATIGLLNGFHEWRWAAADTAFRRAIALSPSYATARSWYSNVLLAAGRIDASLTQLEAARQLDPLSMPIAYGISQAQYYGRRYNDGLISIERVLQISPNLIWARLLKGKLLKESGRRDQARREFAAIGDSMELALLDTTTSAVVVPQRIARISAADKLRSQFWIAQLYARIGKPDSAFAWLERAYAVRQADLSSILVDPGIDNVMRDPRYPEFVARIGLAPPIGQYIVSPKGSQ